MWKRTIGKIALKAIGVCAAAVGIILLILTAAEFRPISTEEPEVAWGNETRGIREGDQIELLTFNIGYAGLDQNADSFRHGGEQNTPESKETIEENLEGLSALLNSQTYDVLFLQEVDRGSKRSYGVDEAEYFHQTVGMTGIYAQDFRCVFVPFPLIDFVGTVSSGIQTLTTLPVQSAQRIALPNSRAWPDRLWQMKHCVLITRVPIENSGRELVLMNLHIGENAEDMEEKQFEALAVLMRQEYEQGNYVIAGGDFNQAFPDDDFSMYPLRHTEYFRPINMDGSLQEEGWFFVSDRSTPSVRLLNEPYNKARWWAQYYVMDGFILSPNVTVEQVKTINAEFRNSDHNPVKLTVRLKDYSFREATEIGTEDEVSNAEET